MVAAAVLPPLALSGCGAGAGGAPPTGDGVVSVVDDAEQADLILYVSNQSFEHAVVGIVVAIDEVVVVDQEFDVEGQHNWIQFPIVLPPGEHTLTATSSTGATIAQPVPVPDGERRWVVVDYWYYPDDDSGSDVVDPSLTVHVSDQPVGFA